MNKFDRIFGGIIFGFIIPIISFCAFWWISVLLELNVLFWAISGVIVGIILDMSILGKLLSKFYYLNVFTLLMLYFVYSIGVFGFFMGVPVFNVLLGGIAGLYVGRKMKITSQTINIYKMGIKRVGKVCSLILLVICCCSAFIAVTEPYTGANLRGMLNLSFEVTSTFIWLVIIFGGAILLLSQHLLLLTAGKIAYEKIN
jgi:hypothetical protein